MGTPTPNGLIKCYGRISNWIWWPYRKVVKNTLIGSLPSNRSRQEIKWTLRRRSTYCAHPRLWFSTSPINHVARIIFHCLVCYTYVHSCFVLFRTLQQCARRERAPVVQRLGMLVYKIWGYVFSFHQVPLVGTTEEFQTERNSCPVLQPVFDFQLHEFLMNSWLEI